MQLLLFCTILGHMDALLRKYSQVFWSTGMGAKASSVYATRRKLLMDTLSSLCIFSGSTRPPGSTEVWTQIGNRQIQDPSVLYLTGINQPGVVLVLDPLAQKPSDREVLFLPNKDPKREFWDGVQLGLPIKASLDSELEVQIVKRITGFDNVQSNSTFNSWLANRLQSLRLNHIYAYWLEFDTSDGVKRIDFDQNWVFRKSLRRTLTRLGKSIEVRNIATTHLHLRSQLDKYQIKMARSAQAYTRRAFLELLPHIPSHVSERTLCAELEYRLLRDTDEGLAFPTIVAAGVGACTLHYQKKDEALRKGQLVLLDFGCRVGSLCSDISRTVPVSGRFNPLQRLLYQIVLDTQRFHQKGVKPGVLLRELSKKTWLFLEETAT